MGYVKRYGRIGDMVEATSGILSLYPSMSVYVRAEDFDAAQAERDQFKAELERLKGGLGEVVAHQFQDRQGAWLPFVSGYHYKCTVEDGTWPIRALYASPPAPVAVLLPERQEVESGEAYLQEDWVSGWNACLDKVKELNK
jgi:hypothetical protein